MYNLSLVIPIYNEAENITILVKEINQILDNKYNYEIIIVNDCSTDQTEFVLKRLPQRFKVVIIKNKKKLGQSRSILEGIKIARNDNIVTLDGDGQNNPKDIPKLLKVYNPNNKIFLVGGIRSKRQDKIYKIITSKIANYIRNLILQDNCLDTGCAIKVFNKEIFLNIPFFDGIHRFLPALYKACGSNNFFINVDHRKRSFGKSKYGTYNRLFRGIRDIAKVIKIISKLKKYD